MLLWEIQSRGSSNRKESEEDGWKSLQKGPQGIGGERRCEDFFVVMGGIWQDIQYREGYDTCGPDRCYGHSHTQSERQRQCEKLMCPTYSSWAETGEGGWEAGMMLDFGSEQTMLCFFFFCALHHANLFLGVGVCAYNLFSIMFS